MSINVNQCQWQSSYVSIFFHIFLKEHFGGPSPSFGGRGPLCLLGASGRPGGASAAEGGPTAGGQNWLISIWTFDDYSWFFTSKKKKKNKNNNKNRNKNKNKKQSYVYTYNHCMLLLYIYILIYNLKYIHTFAWFTHVYSDCQIVIFPFSSRSQGALKTLSSDQQSLLFDERVECFLWQPGGRRPRGRSKLVGKWQPKGTRYVKTCENVWKSEDSNWCWKMHIWNF